MKPLIAIVTSVASLTVLLSAQQTPVFRARTDLVELDVSVLDKDRRPVGGLTQADFTIFEDGKPQEVAIFEAVDAPDPAPPPVAWMRDVTPDVSTNESKASRLWLLVIDDALIPNKPYPTQQSAAIAREVISHFGPDDLATIVFTADSRQAQDFTNDRSKLLATLDNYRPGWATGHGSPDGVIDVNPDWQFQIGALLTIRNAMDALASVAHSRKAMVWITPGMALNFAYEPTEAPRNAAQAQKTMARQQVQLRLIDICKEIFEVARRANIPVFPLAPGDNAMPAGDFSITFANNTGGHAYLNSDRFGTAVDRIFAENGSYYLVGYYPTNGRADGTHRRVEVKVNRQDVEVRTRNGYYAPKQDDLKTKSTNALLANALAEPVPVKQLPLRAAVAPFAIPGRGRTAAVAIALGVKQAVPDAAATGRVTVSTELRASAFTTEGDEFGKQRHTARVVLRAGAQGDAEYEVLSRMDLPPGRYRIRLAAYHNATTKTGTVMADVIVPDFGKEPASMSGVVLGASPSRPSAPRDVLMPILPIVPTAQRAFERTDRTTALFYVYQNGRTPIVPAQVTTRITDGRGATLITEAQILNTDRFVNAQAVVNNPANLNVGGAKSPSTTTMVNPLRAAETQYRLPLDRLPPGLYLLTFEATVGTIVLRRDVQFEVK